MLRYCAAREYLAYEFISTTAESLKLWLAGAEFRNDSAGIKGEFLRVRLFSFSRVLQSVRPSDDHFECVVPAIWLNGRSEHSAKLNSQLWASAPAANSLRA